MRASVYMCMRCLLWESNFAILFCPITLSLVLLLQQMMSRVLHMKVPVVSLKNDRVRFLITLSVSLLAHTSGGFPIFLSLRCCRESRIIRQSGRNCGRSLVQPPAQSRVRYNIRQGQLRALSSLLSKASKDWYFAASLDSHFHSLTVLIVEVFPFTKSELLLIKFMPIVSHFPAIHHLTEWVLQPLAVLVSHHWTHSSFQRLSCIEGPKLDAISRSSLACA